jgi:HSP20 family protein
LRAQFDRQLPNLWDSLSYVTPRVAGHPFPALNVWEEGDNYFAEAEVPGLKNENLEISVVGNELTIQGSRGDESQDGGSYHRRERGVGEFTRVLQLPVDISTDGVTANLQGGVLTIKLPKSEAAKPRKIQVNAN